MKFKRHHIGKIIESYLKDNNISKKELSGRINMSPQNLGQILKKESIETSYLLSISEALNFDFFVYFRADQSTINNVEQNGDFASATFGGKVSYYQGHQEKAKLEDEKGETDPRVLQAKIDGLMATLAAKQETIDSLKLAITNKN